MGDDAQLAKFARMIQTVGEDDYFYASYAYFQTPVRLSAMVAGRLEDLTVASLSKTRFQNTKRRLERMIFQIAMRDLATKLLHVTPADPWSAHSVALLRSMGVLPHVETQERLAKLARWIEHITNAEYCSGSVNLTLAVRVAGQEPLILFSDVIPHAGDASADTASYPNSAQSRPAVLKRSRASVVLRTHLPNLRQLFTPMSTLKPELVPLGHGDNGYREVPPSSALLYAVKNAGNAAANASFADQYAAHSLLPEPLKVQIGGLHIRHDASVRGNGETKPGIITPTTFAEVPGAAHPIVRLHPDTLQPALYLGRRPFVSCIA